MDNLEIPGNEDMVDFGDVYVPDITSKDPEERKQARRIRIDRRIQMQQRLQRLKQEATPEEKQPEKPTLLAQQLEKSGEVLRQLFSECEEQVTNIRVSNDTREVDRREEEGILREKIMAQLEEEAALATRAFEEIATRWTNIMNSNDPLNIHEAIESQKGKCNELIEQKDAVIKMLKMEIRLAEAKFYKDQKTQNEDISTLAKRVEKQVASMRKAHRKELQAIEDVMIQERTNMMDNNSRRWDELYNKREEQELEISQNKLQQRDEFEEVVSNVRVIQNERLRSLKISMERDCQTLQQEFEYIKATALSNSEKMDYNYQILKKREDENLIIKSNQKRKLNKLQDIINGLRKRINDYQMDSDLQLARLLDEVLKLRKCIAGVKNKAKSMSETNEKKYMQVWDLNQTFVMNIVNKLHTIDKILHEQQMGLKWDEPNKKPFIREKLASYITAEAQVEAAKEKTVSKERSEIQIYGELETSAAYRRTLHNVLQQISNSSGFLIEKRLRKILENRDNYENTLIKVDNVFSALGVNDAEDVNVIFHYFKPYVICNICNQTKSETKNVSLDSKSTDDSNDSVHELSEQEEHNALGAVRESDNTVDAIIADIVKPERLEEEREALTVQEGECLGPTFSKEVKEKRVSIQNLQVTEGAAASPIECLYNHNLFVDASCVLRALREFVSNTFCIADDDEKSSNPNMAKKTLTISRLLASEDVKSYWYRFRILLSERKHLLWNALYQGLQKYHAILEDRHKLHEKVKMLRRQNFELRHLLKRYHLDDGMVPPCAQQRVIPLPFNPKRR